MEQKPNIAVIGAGLSGLTTAYYLERVSEKLQLPIDVDILDKNSRVGGVIRSERKGDLLFEGGPEGWASYKPAAKRLVTDLEIQSQILGSNDSRRKTYVIREGDLKSLPDGMTFLAPVEPIAFWKSAPLSFRGKLRASLEPFVPRTRGDLSVKEFFVHRLGEEFSEKLVEPLISAVYGSRYEELSAPSSLPELHGAEQRRGSLWRGLRQLSKYTSTVSILHTMKEGMAALVAELERGIERSRFHLGVEGLSLARSNGRYRLTAPGFDGTYDQVVLCTPARATGEILRGCAPGAKAPLGEIPYSSSTIVYLAYRKAEFSHPLNGFGFIVPAEEAKVLDACTWVSTKFDHRCPPELVLLRCAIHSGRRNRPALADRELLASVHHELTRLLKISCTPVEERVYRTEGALPQLLVGHRERLRRLDEAMKDCPGVHIAGSFYGGVGVPDCIRTGQETAARVIEMLT